MARHWTYDETPSAKDDLYQGDILHPTEELLDCLEKRNLYTNTRGFLGFMVISQCCDLVRRGTHPCKAQHIAIVEIRELQSVLHGMFDSVCTRVCHGVYLNETKIEARQLLGRVLNQNEQALGLFYLHPCQEGTGFTDESVALLRAATTLPRSEYEKLVSARRGRLLSQFRNKLGWLVGNLYSRVGTPDWGEADGGIEAQESLIRKFTSLDTVEWVKSSLVKSARKNGVDLGKVPVAEIRDRLDKFKPISLKDRVTEEAQEQLETLHRDLAKSVCGQTSTRISSILSESGQQVPQQTLRQLIEEKLNVEFESLVDDLAARTTTRILDEIGAPTDNSAELDQQVQYHLAVALKSALEGMPAKLRKRLENSPVLGEVGKIEDTLP